MSMPRKRRMRRPVFSRLTLAWSIFGCAGLALGGYALISGSFSKQEKIELALDDDVQTMVGLDLAQREQRPTLRGATGVTLASGGPLTPPVVNETPPDEDTFDAEDVYANLPTIVSTAPDEITNDPYQDEIYSDEVVITIEGAPARGPAQKLALATPAPFSPGDPGAVIAEPVAELLRKTTHGFVPKIASNGRRPSKAYAKPYNGPKNKPRIAIVVGGLGLNKALTERAIEELPASVTLAFAPYAKNLDYWTERARKNGHEIAIELPMEAHTGAPSALGPAALLTNRTAAENLERLDWILSRFQGYFAATNYLGGKFSANPSSIKPVLDRLREAGVAYIDDTGAIRRAGAAGDWTIVNRMITPGQSGTDAGAVKRDLSALEKIALRDGDALGKTFANDVAISEIAAWSRELANRDIAMAPASTVLHARGPAF